MKALSSTVPALVRELIYRARRRRADHRREPLIWHLLDDAADEGASGDASTLDTELYGG